MKDADGLTPRQRAFVNAYLREPNATQAAIAAGYAAGSAGVTGHRLLNNAKIANVLAPPPQAGQQTALEETTVTRAWLVAELKENLKLARKNEHEGPANRALELLGKLHGHFTERVDFTDDELDRMTIDELRMLGTGRIPPRLRVVH